MPQQRIPTITRYLSKVQRSSDPDGCWTWTGAKDGDGYGIFWDGTYRESGRGNYVRITRWTYKQFVGPIPDGKQLCHTCDNPSCVNPAHLFPGTSKDNHVDREAKGRGRRCHGSTHVGSKLTEEQVLAIRAERAAGASQADLAAKHSVSTALVSKIVNRKVWTHI